MSLDLSNIPSVCLNGEVLGCTYSEAANFNPNATFEDGSCQFNLPNHAYNLVAFGHHYRQCNANIGGQTVNTAAFFLYFKFLTGSPVDIEPDDLLLVRAYAYPYIHSGSFGGGIKDNCSVGIPYIENPVVIGSEDRVSQGIKNNWVIPINSAEMGKSHPVEVYANESNVDFFNVPRQLPIEVTVINAQTNRRYTRNITINLFSYTTGIDYLQQIYNI